MEPVMHPILPPAPEQAPSLKRGGSFRDNLEGFDMRCYESSAVEGSGSLSPPTAYFTNGASRTLIASASQASVATTAAGSTATSGNNSPRGNSRAVLPVSRQGAANSTTRPRSAGRVGQLSRTNTANGNTAAPGGGSVSSTSRAETSRQSPRRQVSRGTASVAGGMYSGSSSSSRATGKAATGNAGGASRHPNSTFGSRYGVGDDARFGRPNSSARGSFGGNGDVLSSRAKSPGSRPETPQGERAAARQRACSPGGRTGTPTGRRRSPGPPSGRVQERSLSPLPGVQTSQAEWNGYPDDHTGMSTSSPSSPNVPQGMSLVDVLVRIASALEKGGEESGATSGATAAAVVAAAASAVAEAHRPFAMSRPGVPPMPGALRSAPPGDTAHGRGGASPPLREREGDRSLQQEGGKPSAPSSGSSSNAAMMLQMFSELEARMDRTEQNLATVAANQTSAQLDAEESGAADEQTLARLHALESRAARLEHEVADLRAQVGRRLDSVARDAAVSRREAEEARSEAATLRSEVAELMAQLLQAPALCNVGLATRSASDRDSGLLASGRSDETSTSSLPQSGSAGLVVRTLKQESTGDVEADLSASTTSSGNIATRAGTGSIGDEQVQVIQHSVKFVPAPLAAADTSAAHIVSPVVVGPQRGVPSRLQSARPPSATLLGSGSSLLKY